MSKDEALNLALKALEADPLEMVADANGHMVFLKDKAITAIKEALMSHSDGAQPEQHQDWCASLTQMLMSMPPKPAPCNCKPPQRTWVNATTWRGLTDEEIYSVLENLQVMHHRPPTTDSRVIFAQAIEAKLKEKNT